MFVELVFRSEARRNPKKQAWVDFLWGAALSVVLALGWFLFGKSASGEEFQRLTYQLLQTQLTSGNDPMPITLVDISNLLPTGEGEVTSRRSLQSLLTVLAKYNPSVIGVDIDFSPLLAPDSRLKGFLTPSDPEFFEFCEALSVPVYLGIYRTRALDPAEWLADRKYSNLAAALVTRKDPRKVAVSIGKHKGVTIAAALAGRHGRNEQKGYWNWLLVTASNTDIGGWELEEAMPDYSIAQRLEDRCIRINREAFDNGDTLNTVIRPRKNDIEGKMLLIGDVVRNDDAFPNPATEDSLPGVLVHAAAAYTAVMKPLYRIRESLEPWTDLILSLIVLFIVLAVRWFSSARMSVEKLHKSVTLLFVFGVLVLGISVNRTRILWEGFLVAAIALALHPFADRIFKRFSVWLHSSSQALGER